MPVKLDDDKIKYVIREKEKGTPNAMMVESMKISSLHVRCLWTGTIVSASCRRSAVVVGLLLPRQFWCLTLLHPSCLTTDPVLLVYETACRKHGCLSSLRAIFWITAYI